MVFAFDSEFRFYSFGALSFILSFICFFINVISHRSCAIFGHRSMKCAAVSDSSPQAGQRALSTLLNRARYLLSGEYPTLSWNTKLSMRPDVLWSLLVSVINFLGAGVTIQIHTGHTVFLIAVHSFRLEFSQV